jgi:putative transferase (TIGR04331 family)
MFLITTADRRFWKTDEPVLFLGEWCRLFKDRHIWTRLDHEVLPYHWDDRERFAADWHYLNATYEKYLGLFADRLNLIHGTHYSNRYWRILIGIWLRSFIDAVYDRYLSLSAAAKTGRVTNTWICRTDAWPPTEIPSYSFDAHNLYLYSRIIKALGTIPYEEKDLAHWTGVADIVSAKSSSGVRRLSAEVVRQARKGFSTVLRQGLAVLALEVYPQLLRHVPAKVVFVGTMYLSLRDQVRLQASLGQIPFLYHGRKIRVDATAPNPAMRRQLTLPDSTDPFEQLLNGLLPEQIPMVYVEAYKRAHARALAVSPGPPRIAVSASSMNYRLCFEFWAAHHTECSGMKLLISQHGGFYGSAQYSSIEEHLVRICDRYYTWGSELDGARVAKPMPSFRLRTTARALSVSNPAGPIMWIATTMARYRTFAEADTAGPNMLHYIDEQQRFLRALSTAPRDLLVWRYFNDLWEEEQRWKELQPGLTMQKGRKKQLGRDSDFTSELRKCRLAIHTTNGTTYLEALAADFPSLVFWNPVDLATRPSLQPYFDELLTAGVLHYTPESAARKLNEIYGTPGKWWSGADVQRARSIFCEGLARTSPDWLPQWIEELTSWTSGACPDQRMSAEPSKARRSDVQ